MAITLGAGDVAPDFALADQDGAISIRWPNTGAGRSSSTSYPRDETPGCTTQACSFRDGHAEILAEGAIVLGVSRDDADSHLGFPRTPPAAVSPAGRCRSHRLRALWRLG